MQFTTLSVLLALACSSSLVSALPADVSASTRIGTPSSVSGSSSESSAVGNPASAHSGSSKSSSGHKSPTPTATGSAHATPTSCKAKRTASATHPEASSAIPSLYFATTSDLAKVIESEGTEYCGRLTSTFTDLSDRHRCKRDSARRLLQAEQVLHDRRCFRRRGACKGRQQDHQVRPRLYGRVYLEARWVELEDHYLQLD